jgi:transcriptional regulator with XRE-family HTH domain
MMEKIIGQTEIMDNKTKYWYGMSDPAIIEQLGNFIKTTRLKQNKTQQVISEVAGINRSTVVKMENGSGGTLLSFIQVLRALEQLQLLQIFETEQEVSPLQLAKIEMNKRQRAGKKTSANNKPVSTW